MRKGFKKVIVLVMCVAFLSGCGTTSSRSSSKNSINNSSSTDKDINQDNSTDKIERIVAKGDLVYSYECGDDATWAVYSDGVVEITGTGEVKQTISNYSVFENLISKEYDIDLEEDIKTIAVGEGITSTENLGVYGFYSVTKVILPESLEKIGSFGNFIELEEIEIPDKVKVIPNYAFESNHKLKSVKFADDITGIGSSAFAYCDSLKEIVIPETVTYILNNAFLGWKKDQTVILKGRISRPDDFYGLTCEYCKQTVVYEK